MSFDAKIILKNLFLRQRQAGISAAARSLLNTKLQIVRLTLV